MNKTYELWKGQKINISYFHSFGCEYSKCDNELLLGYSKMSKAHRVYNSRILVVEEVIHVRFNDNKLDKELSKLDKGFCRYEVGQQER